MASSKILSSMLTIFITLIVFSIEPISSLPSFENLPVPSSVGPHSIAFDSLGRGPYTGVSDGRILMYKKSRTKFVNFAYTSPNRTRKMCDGVKTLDLLSTCGRPLSLAFLHQTKQLFIADANLGLFVVGRKGGQASQLASEAEGVQFLFTVGLDVDQSSRNIYFTDASSTRGIDEVDKLIATRDSTGRLLKYDLKTKRVSVLLRKLSGASGVAISKNGTFLLVTEFIGSRIQKYWLRGPKANTAEIIMNVTGTPDNIRRTKWGDFWVAVTSPEGQLLGVRINGFGNILETLNFSPQFEPPILVEVQEYGNSIYLGSLHGENVGVYKA